MHQTKEITLLLADNEHSKVLKDPFSRGLFHLEAWLPFSQAAKLDPGNANVRPASGRKKPFRDMVDTVELDPSTFHVKNRGIVYRCEKFEIDPDSQTLTVTVPDMSPDHPETDGCRFGIADGGHTFEVIQQTMARENELLERHGWREPYVRVHFLSGSAAEVELEQIVEALNVSSQVQRFTLDEYQNKFDDLKGALGARGFNTDLVAFRENEDDKDWDVREIVQRMACFLKDRWKNTQPINMYKSKGKALDLYTGESTREEFARLYDVVDDIITLPEYIQSEFSRGDVSRGRKFGKMKAVKTLKKTWVRPGTTYHTDHEMDLVALLPLAAAFRECLELDGDRYHWSVDPKEVFQVAADELYRALLGKMRAVRGLNALAGDTEYWTQASNIVLRAKDTVLRQGRAEPMRAKRRKFVGAATGALRQQAIKSLTALGMSKEDAEGSLPNTGAAA